MVIGVISDTHGLLRPEALAALAGSELIIHAGDIGPASVLEAMRAIAPVVAVRGNVDRSGPAAELPETEVVSVGRHSIYVLHDLHRLDLHPRAAGFSAVISGHTHAPVAERKGGVLYLNPGSAGPRRFKLPICLAKIHVRDEALEHEMIVLG